MMKIRQIQIRGFGHFADLSIDSFPDGLVVVEGANEAGKTTLMSFIKAILFGFADRRTNQLRYEPIRGGEHGGSITLETDDGELYRVERRPGPSRGEVVIYHSDGVWQGEHQLKRFLNGVSEPLFQQIFCFGLDELQQLDSLQSEEISGLIYSAGMGTFRRRSYLQIQKDLTEMQGQLYKPSGKNPKINRLLRTLEEKEATIRELQTIPEEYNHLTGEIGELNQQIAELEDQISQLEAEEIWLTRLEQACEPFQQIQQMNAELVELPEIDQFPHDGIHRLEQLKEERLDLQGRLARKEREKTTYFSQLDELTIHLELLGAISEIRELVEERRLFQDWLKKKTELEVQITQQREKVEQFLLGLGSKWNQTKVKEFPLTFDRRERVLEFQQQRILFQHQEEELRVEERQLSRLREERELEVQDQKACSQIIFSRRQFDQGVENGGRLVGFAGVISLSSLVLAGWFFVQTNWMIAGVMALLGLTLLGGTFYLRQFLKRQKTVVKQQRQDEMEKARDELQVKELALERVNQQQRDLIWRQDELVRKKEFFDQEWSEFLVANQISLQRIPSDLLELFKLLEKGKELIQHLEEGLTQCQLLQKQIEQYYNKAKRLLSHLNRSIVEPTDLSSVIMQIQEELIDQEKKNTKYEQIQMKLEETELDLADLAFQLETREKEWTNLLKAGGAGTEEEFRQRWFAYEQRTEVLKARRQWEIALHSIAVVQAEEMNQALHDWDLATIQGHSARVRRQRQEAKEELANFQDQRGRYQAQVELMEHSDQLSILRQEREELIAQLREQSEEWLSVALCQRFMELAKDLYEKERQPGVLRQASRILQQLTAGIYQRVLSPLGESCLQVERRDGTRLVTEALSRGTAEQLYLAMRLALAQEYSSRTVGFPLIMDDIFVNFDPGRTRAGLNVLSQLASEQQVIFFTCHPHLLTYLEEAGVGYCHLKLEEFMIKHV